jgi:hypothetical protein
LGLLAFGLVLEDPQLLEKPPHLQAVAGVDDQGWFERDSLCYAHGVLASGREVFRLVRGERATPEIQVKTDGSQRFADVHKPAYVSRFYDERTQVNSSV